MMILIGPFLMFAGLVVAALCADRTTPREKDAALEEYALERWDNEDREQEPDVDPHTLERLGRALEGVER